MASQKSLQKIATDYLAENPEATAREIAAWAIQEGRWTAPPNALEKSLAEDISRAMREEFVLDPQGRSVRAKHAARIRRDGVQGVFWSDKRTATHRHMEISFQQRRQGIVGDCIHLKTDVDSYNENAKPPKNVQMVFDFTQDLAEIEALRRSAAAEEAA